MFFTIVEANKRFAPYRLLIQVSRDLINNSKRQVKLRQVFSCSLTLKSVIYETVSGLQSSCKPLLTALQDPQASSTTW